MNSLLNIQLQLIITAFLASISCSYAQLQPYGPGGIYLNTQNNDQRVGIGNFAGNPPLSALHIHGNLVSNPTGEVFRTDAPANRNTSWRMFRGGTQMGRIFNSKNDNHLRIQSTRNNSDIVFHSRYNNLPQYWDMERM